MKRTGFFILLACVFTCVFSLVGAEKKLLTAIIGSEPASDLLFAGLAEDERFELIEREDVKKLLDEQSLSKLNSASLVKRFPHTGLFVVFRARDVVVFDAKNGTLLTKILRTPPVKGVSSTPEELAKTLLARLSAFAEREKKAVCLPPVSITNAMESGAPAVFRKKYVLCTDLLEQKISDDPEAVCLERRALGNVNTERELADAAFPLSASACLIRLEFTQGERAGTADCAVFLFRPDGTGMKKLYFKDIFSERDTVKKASEMWLEIKGFLISGQSVSVAPKPRGSSHANEARKIVESIRAEEPVSVKLEKLEAAIALNPKRRYIEERMLLKRGELDSQKRRLGNAEYLRKLDALDTEMAALKIAGASPVVSGSLTHEERGVLSRILERQRRVAVEKLRAEVGRISTKNRFFEQIFMDLSRSFIRPAVIDAEDFLLHYPEYLSTYKEFFEDGCVKMAYRDANTISSYHIIGGVLFGSADVWRLKRGIMYSFMDTYANSKNLIVRSAAERIKFVKRLDSLPPSEATLERLIKELDAHEIEMRSFLGIKGAGNSILDQEIKVLSRTNGGAFPDEVIAAAEEKYIKTEKRTFYALWFISVK